MENKQKPEFVIVGAPRSGTTYLMMNLASHPQIFMPVPNGEHATGDLHFFDVGREEGRNNFDRGLEWYLRHFSDAAPNQCVGEKSADYLADEQACRLICETLGRVRILVLLRDPVARAYSHFWHERHNLAKFGDFGDLLDHGADVGDALVLKSSRYHEPLSRYLQTFGTENVMVLVAEEMYQQPETALADVCRFLGVDPSFRFPLSGATINRGTAAFSVQWIRRIAARLQAIAPGSYDSLRTSALGSVAKAFVGKRRGTGANATRGDTPESTYPPIPRDQLIRARELFRQDALATGELLGRNLLTIWWPDCADN